MINSKQQLTEGWSRMFSRVRATAGERSAALPGDELIERSDVTMDRGFTVPGTPLVVMPWLTQLGKQRAGWYLPRRVERLIPQRRRAIRHLDDRWLALQPGDVIPDYGGANETFTVVDRTASHIVYESRRGHLSLTWAIVLTAAGSEPATTRVHLRLRLAHLKHPALARTGGELLDVLTIAGMAAGLAERLADHQRLA